jgi:hypothetical protein
MEQLSCDAPEIDEKDLDPQRQSCTCTRRALIEFLGNLILKAYSLGKIALGELFLPLLRQVAAATSASWNLIVSRDGPDLQLSVIPFDADPSLPACKVIAFPGF